MSDMSFVEYYVEMERNALRHFNDVFWSCDDVEASLTRVEVGDLKVGIATNDHSVPWLTDLPSVLRPEVIEAAQEALPKNSASSERQQLAALCGVQLHDCPGGQVAVVFPGTSPEDCRLLAVLVGDKTLASVWPLPYKNHAPIVHYIEAGLRLLFVKASPLAGSYARLMSNIVVAGKRGSTASSSSGAVGGVFFSPRASWPASKYAEILIHEFVHQAVFLDEATQGMWAPEVDLEAPENLVVSAVRRVPRGFDKSFHAAYVAYVQRRLYVHLGVPDPSGIGSLEETIEGLNARAERCLTKHGLDRLTELTALNQTFPESTAMAT